MSHSLSVHALPSLVPVEQLPGSTVVIIDVLRASTTIIHALAAGAREVIPCEEIDEARRAAAELPPGSVVLGGERKGLPIDGFELGNSPTEYTPDMVADRSVVITTSNGTRAILRCRPAGRVLVGAFANVTAVYEQLLEADDIHLVCAGTDDQYSRDDVLFAGLLVERLRQSGISYDLNAQALTARENWVSSFPVPEAIGAEPLAPERLAVELRRSAGGQNLISVGLEDDIFTAAHLDLFDVVPELVPGRQVLRAAGRRNT